MLFRAARTAILLQMESEIASECTSTDCASISIIDCTFSNFNFLKTSLGDFQPLLMSDSVMKYQGIILSLTNFYGDIVISGNTFQQIRFVYPHCSLTTQTSNSFSETPWNTINVEQVKSLIRVEVHSNILIKNNRFLLCNSHSGLIHLEKSGNAYAIAVKGNIFRQNSALGVAN